MVVGSSSKISFASINEVLNRFASDPYMEHLGYVHITISIITVYNLHYILLWLLHSGWLCKLYTYNSTIQFQRPICWSPIPFRIRSSLARRPSNRHPTRQSIPPSKVGEGTLELGFAWISRGIHKWYMYVYLLLVDFYGKLNIDTRNGHIFQAGVFPFPRPIILGPSSPLPFWGL